MFVKTLSNNDMVYLTRDMLIILTSKMFECNETNNLSVYLVCILYNQLIAYPGRSERSAVGS